MLLSASGKYHRVLCNGFHSEDREDMYNVIHGSYKQFQHLKGCYSWDILPGVNLALEHGLNVTIDDNSYNGEFLAPGVKYRFMIK